MSNSEVDSCFVGIQNQHIKSNKKIINNYNILGKATLSKLMKDEKLYNNFEKSTSELAELIEDIKNNPKRYVNFSILGGTNKSFEKKKSK